MGHRFQEPPELPSWEDTVRLIIRDEISKAHLTCRFPISDDHVKEAAHMIGMVSDLGAGNLAQGIEEVRENHKWITSIRERGAKIGTTLFVFIILTIAGGALGAFWLGVKGIFGAEE